MGSVGNAGFCAYVLFVVMCGGVLGLGLFCLLLKSLALLGVGFVARGLCCMLWNVLVCEWSSLGHNCGLFVACVAIICRTSWNDFERSLAGSMFEPVLKLLSAARGTAFSRPLMTNTLLVSSIFGQLL